MDQLISATQSEWERIEHLTIKLPAPALLEIHNSLPRDHHARAVILSHLKQAAKMNVSAHWIRALILDEQGNLNLDPILYRKAVSRGKQETYFASAKKVFEELQFSLSQLSAYQIEEMNTSEALEDGNGQNTLVSMPDISDGVAALQKHTAAITALANKMTDGLPALLNDPATTQEQS